MTTNERIAHDLAIAYVSNRFGPEVSGDFSVSTLSGDTSGFGTVETERLPGLEKTRRVKVSTGEKHFFGLLEKMETVESGFEIDPIFERMIEEYHGAYARLLSLLENG